MKIIDHGDKTAVYGGRFTGTAELEMLNATPTDDEPDTAFVHFKDGAVSFWHMHPGGQQLFVVRGNARVGTDADGEVRLAPGTLVICPPNERHWHGAAPGNDTTLLAVTWGTTQWETLAPECATT